MERQMKNSNFDWIGIIPTNWKISKVKHHFENYKKIVGNDSVNYDRLALTLNGVIKREKEDGKGLQPKNFDNYQILKKDDLIFKLIDLQNTQTSRIGLSNFNGIVSPAYIALHPLNVDKKYAEYFFKMMWKQHIFNTLGNDGVRSSLNATDLLNISFLVPPLEEQEKIAKYLDLKIPEIDKTINETKKTIELYKEYKKSVITEVVTKGLDPNIEMKDSGIEWIGEIPKDWEITKIKYISKIYGRIGFRGYTQKDLVGKDEGAITLSPSNFFDMKMNYDNCSYLSWNKYYESPEIMIENGDILFVKTGSSYGKSCLVKNLPQKSTINPQLIVFKNILINKFYFSYFLQSNIIDRFCKNSIVGGTIPTLSQEKINNYFVFLPHNQQQIVDYLDQKCLEIDNLIKEKEDLVLKLEEYKKSLIYECVTGKKEID